MAKKFNFIKGRQAEGEARVYLEKQGFKFISANYKNKIGEIDLIMSDNDWLVFVEVKYKSDDRMGIPEEMIDKNKIWQVKRVAESFLMERKKDLKKFEKYRIDAVCILGKEIKHYENIDE